MPTPTYQSPDSYGYEANSQQAPGPLDLKYLIPRLLSRWPWIVIGLAIGLIIGFIQVKRSVPHYKSTATLIVKGWNVSVMGQFDPSDIDLRGQEAVETIRAGFDRTQLFEKVAADPIVRDLPNLKTIAAPSIVSLFSKPESKFEGQVIEEAPPMAQLAGMIRSWTSSWVREDSRFINVEVVHTDPKVAQVIVNRLVFHFIDLREKSKSSGARGNLEYLLSESNRVKSELQEARTLTGSYSSTFSSEKSLVIAEEEFNNLTTRYLEKHPKMISAKALFKAREVDLKKQLSASLNNPLDAEFWSEYKTEFQDFSDPSAFNTMRSLMQARQATLESKVETLGTLYESLLERVQSQQVTAERAEAEAMPHESGNIAGAPFAPNKKGILMKASFLGLFGGLLVAFAFQYFDDKIHSVEDIEQHLGLSSLAVIHKLGDEKELQASKRSLTLPPSLTRISPTIATINFSDDAMNSEMFRILRASITLLGDKTKRKVTLITSSLPGEGKTSIASSLAISYSRQGTKTLLLDFDLRKPAMHKAFGESRAGRPGMVNVLTRTNTPVEAIVTYPDLPNLDVIFAGPKSPNPGELLDTEIITELLAQFKEHYDHIIIDSAPLLAVPDTRILAQFCDNLGLVIRADSTPRKALSSALELLASSGIAPDGAILNDFTESRLRGSKYQYSYHYGVYGEN